MSDVGIFQAIEEYTEKVKIKENNPTGNVIFSSVWAGILISFGAFVSVNVGMELPVGMSKFIGGISFSSALIMIVLLGFELFTGNVLTTFSYLKNKFKWYSFLKLWIVVYLGNLTGCLLTVFLLKFSGLCDSLQEKFNAIASMKASLTFPEAFIRGMFCNILVCIAVLIAAQAKTVQGKIFGIMVPITVFIASGYEHSIANMFFLPMGDVNPVQFLHNIIPVTLGNIAGALFLIIVLFLGLKNQKV